MPAPEFTFPNYVYRAEVIHVVDGDTIDVKLDLGFHLTAVKRLRFLGIDTYEVRGEEKDMGLVAKARLEELLNAASTVYVQTKMDAEGKYGRVLAWVWLDAGEGPYCVNFTLLEEGLGVPA